MTFNDEVRARIDGNGKNEVLRESAKRFLDASFDAKYCYNFAWQGRPIIQYPQDVLAMQELIWTTRPDLIIEAGIAHGGSLVFSASLLASLDMCDAIEAGTMLDPRESCRKVLGIDIDVRTHNRAAIEAHPMASRIQMIEASSVTPETVEQVRSIASQYSRILVCLDSNHTHDHVLAELEAYAPLVSTDSYCVVFDTVVEDLPKEVFPDRPWGPGNNPKTAVWEYLRRLNATSHLAADGKPLQFEIDRTIENKVVVTVAPGGYLKRVTR